jgi:hypothetical protein
MSVEVAALREAIEKYKTKVGDYPPNFRDYNAFIRHVRTRYPKISPANLNGMIQYAWGPGFSVGTPPGPTDVPLIDEGESLVFWLALTFNDPVNPFPSATTPLPLINAPNRQVYYEFDSRRLSVTGNTLPSDGDAFPAYIATYAKDTFYLYIDSRSYDELTSDFTDPTTAAFGELSTVPANLPNITHDMVVRPYATDSGSAMNPTSFQILCAGQDGDWGNVDPIDGYATAVKGFPGGMNYSPGDMDNITNFSEGGTLEDKIP